ncbi:MAG: WG repeat-containing protein, partial [Elusimicrobia bacterium]|nr:WG repeat-containing protein [Elusimicrobiota bacterium]
MPPETGNSSRKYPLRAFAFKALAALSAAAAACGRAGAAGPEPFEAGGSWGYRDAGLTVIEPVYAAAGPFSEGVAEVRLPDGDWALIGRSGTEIQRSSSPVIGVLSGGLAVFVRDGRFGYKDAGGREVIPAALSGAGLFSEKLAPAKKEKWGFINRAGKFVIGPDYETVRPFSGGLAAFRRNGRWGFLGKNGKRAVNSIFHGVRDFSEGLAAVRLDSRWGYIDTEGRLALAPDYGSAGSFSDGLAVVSVAVPVLGQYAPRSETRWIDREGAVVYRSAGPAGDGLEIIVSSMGRYGFAKDLAFAVPVEFETAAGCGAGLCLAGKGGRQIFIDRSGGVVRETDFDEAAQLGCGLY